MSPDVLYVASQIYTSLREHTTRQRYLSRDGFRAVPAGRGGGSLDVRSVSEAREPTKTLQDTMAQQNTRHHQEPRWKGRWAGKTEATQALARGTHDELDSRATNSLSHARLCNRNLCFYTPSQAGVCSDKNTASRYLPCACLVGLPPPLPLAINSHPKGSDS